MGKRGKVGNTPFWDSATANNRTYNHYWQRIMEMAVTRFEWINLPSTVDERYLELALITDGHALFFYDDVLGYLALRSANGGKLNVYDVPDYRTVVANNGYRYTGTEKDSVIIYNNFLRTSSAIDIQLYAERLANLDRTIDVNVNSQKTPVLISCNQQQQLTMKNLYMKYEGNSPYIFGDNSISPDVIKVLKTDSPYVSDKLYILKEQIWNEVCGYLGIANISYQKKERMIRDEVQRGNGGYYTIKIQWIDSQTTGLQANK
jgi:Phage Connector (GP10).